MKKFLLLFIAAMQLTAVYSQKINYQKTFEEAKTKAKLENKPIFISLTMPIPKSAQLANANFTTGLDEKNIIDFYNKNFICYTINASDTTANHVQKIVNTNMYPAYIFLDSKAMPVYKSFGNSIMPQKYLDMAQEALDQIASGKTIGHYEELHKNGNITAAELKEYIKLKEQLELFNNAGLINDYVDLLTVKALNDYNEILFILQAGPVIESKAYRLCRANQKIYDSIYRHEPTEIRKAINNRIINNTRVKAISTKNLMLMQQLSGFIIQSWTKNYREGAKASAYNMLTYYKAIKDTDNYLRQADFYYDSNYLNISTDSAKKLQKIALDQMKESSDKRRKDDNVTIEKLYPNKTIHIKTISGAANDESPGIVATVLNNAAYGFYLLGTHNTTHLVKALMWSRRAIELMPVSGFYDTMAHIMYRLNFYDEARLNQEKAINLARSELKPKADLDKLKAELTKIKEHKL